MKEKQYIFRLDFSVRDYECDLQGIVNNAVYMHYLEHARHEYLLSRGISFSALHDEGTDLIVIRAELDYKFPLRSGDRFTVGLNLVRSGNLRLVFEQDIFKIPDKKLIVEAKVTGVALKNGRPVSPDRMLSLAGLDIKKENQEI